MIHTKRNLNQATMYKKNTQKDSPYSKRSSIGAVIRPPLVIGAAAENAFKEINKVYDPKNAQISFEGQLAKHSKQGSALEKR
jgi:hypothetical protein